MKVVIDIPEEVYNNMVVKNEYTDMDVIALHNALMGAKPLPCKKEVKEIKHFEDVVTIKTQYDLIEDKIVGKIKYDTETIFNEGYNSCLDEILGETE